MSDNPNAGNQYDHPNQEVVGTDITSGAGNEVVVPQESKKTDTPVSEAPPSPDQPPQPS